MFGLLGLVIGILMILMGGFLVFFFPFVDKFQNQMPSGAGGASFDVAGVILGLVLIFFGFALVLL